MSDQSLNRFREGVTLEKMLVFLESHFGWEELADRIRVNCFTYDPSIKSSLKFLRRTPWAREKVERLYVKTQQTLEDQKGDSF